MKILEHVSEQEAMNFLLQMVGMNSHKEFYRKREM